jgi:hypothetical protein
MTTINTTNATRRGVARRGGIFGACIIDGDVNEIA